MNIKVVVTSWVILLCAQLLNAKPATAPAPKVASRERTITITNNITDAMLAYKYGFITLHPTLTLFVEGKPMARGTKRSTKVRNNRLTLRHSYDFRKPHKKSKGTREVVFELDPHATTYSIGFNWKYPWHFKVNNAKPISSKEKFGTTDF